MAQEVQRVFSRRYSAEGRAQPSLEGLMRSTEQPTETDGDGHGGIRARLDGIADYVGKIAGGILRLPVEVFGGALNLLHLSLHLGLHVSCNPAEAFFNLPAEILGGPGHAMFVHWYSPWLMSPHQRRRPPLVQNMTREWESGFVGAPRPRPASHPLVKPFFVLERLPELANGNLHVP
jgi:hypothetical protein